MDPCAFIHYSDSNIREKTLLEALQSPLFMQYHDNMPFNENMLKPCPMLENPQLLREMVERTGAHGTNEESDESVEHLCSKCDEYAKVWGPEADKIWAEKEHSLKGYENYDPKRLEELEAAEAEEKNEKNPVESVA